MTDRADPRTRIVRAAADLLAREGRAAVSTRAVSAAAGVQAPAIYRQFGDMHELLLAAASEVFARYVKQKATRAPLDDPFAELEHGWDLHVAFGLANPAAYTLIYGEAAHGNGPATDHERSGYAMLEALVGRAAATGRVRVSVADAARMIHAGACGVTLSLISTPKESRDPRLSHAMRDAVYAAIFFPAAKGSADGKSTVAARASALRAALPEARGSLSAGERELMGEWLDRLATGEARARGTKK